MNCLEHLCESGMNWQYGIVHRLALAGEDHPIDEPPAGDGWILNTAAGVCGRVLVIPAWSDGSIVQQRTHWRRSVPGMRHWQLNAHVSENRRPWWVGSRVPSEHFNASLI